VTANTPLPPAHAASDATRFVLVRPSHAGNVGAAARAIKVMGFRELVLVQPRLADVCSHEDAVAMASGAADILARARTVDSLDDALVGITHACATAMTPRDFGPPTAAPREHFATLAPQVLAGGQRVALVFGNERYGMANDDVWRCHACVSIPTHPDYGSLNLAQAVQLVAYDWRQALGAYAVQPRTRQLPPASADQLAGALAHWQQVLVQIGFLDPAVPRRLLPRLQQLLNRAQPTDEEIHILRGIARAVSRAAQASAPAPRQPTPLTAADAGLPPAGPCAGPYTGRQDPPG
jgi:tRNA/rRNA methyltransferase